MSPILFQTVLSYCHLRTNCSEIWLKISNTFHSRKGMRKRCFKMSTISFRPQPPVVARTVFLPGIVSCNGLSPIRCHFIVGSKFESTKCIQNIVSKMSAILFKDCAVVCPLRDQWVHTGAVPRRKVTWTLSRCPCTTLAAGKLSAVRVVQGRGARRLKRKEIPTGHVISQSIATEATPNPKLYCHPITNG